MRLSFTCIGALALAVVLSLMTTRDLTAQEKKAQKAEQKKSTNIQGVVTNMSKDMITVRLTDSASPITRQVVIDSKTKFMYGHSNDNKPGDISKVKMQYFISCEGNLNDKQQLMAEACVYRETK
jgi:hypothetical protein